MRKKIQLTDFWREKMRHFRPLPPNDAWKSIQFQMDVDEVWNRIENSLDIEEVWERMEPALPSGHRKKILPVYYLAAASIALLLGLFFFLPQKEQPKQLAQSPSSLEITTVTKEMADDTETRSTDISPFSAQENTLKQMPAEHATGSRVTSSSRIHEGKYSSIAEVSSEPSSPYSCLNSIPASPLPENENLLAQVHPAADIPAATSEERKYSPWKVGISAHLNNHWLLNETTYGGLTPDNLTTTLPEFGLSFQVTLGRDIHPRWGLRVESEWTDQGGQSYKQYIHGHYLKKSIHLQYFTLQTLLLRHHSDIHNPFPGRGSLIMGLYGSYLSEAREEVERYPSIDLQSAYRNYDFGIILGYEQHINFSHRIEATPGVRVHFGIPNVYRGNNIIPGYFMKTNRASFRFQLGFSYRF